MGFAAAQKAVLTAHPSTAGDVVRGLAVRVLIEEPGILRLGYSLDADLSRVRVPSSRAGSRTDGLWRHTCYEAFVAPADAAGYCELNFSPSLDWAINRRSEEHTSELQSPCNLVCRLLLEKKKTSTHLRAVADISSVPVLSDLTKVEHRDL